MSEGTQKLRGSPKAETSEEQLPQGQPVLYGGATTDPWEQRTITMENAAGTHARPKTTKKKPSISLQLCHPFRASCWPAGKGEVQIAESQCLCDNKR